MTARTPYEYPLAAHAADADAALSREQLADELGREATVYLEAVALIDEMASARNTARIREHLRAAGVEVVGPA